MKKNKLLIIISGLPGSGKSSVGKLLSEETGFYFFDADSEKSSKIRGKMKSGKLISESNRDKYFLDLILNLKSKFEDNEDIILCESIICEKHRLLFLNNFDKVLYINLVVPTEVLRDRIYTREGHMFTIDLFEDFLKLNEEIKIKHFDIDGTKNVGEIVKIILEKIR